MDRATTFLAGAALGAGLMYLFDPRMGRRRRAQARDQMVSLGHQGQEAASVVGRDMRNRAQGLASGDFSVLAGGRRGMRNFVRSRWSPSARALMGLAGAGMFFYGLTREAPTACVLGTIGLVLAAEGIANASIEDITHIPQEVASKATNLASSAAERLGFGENQSDGRQRSRAQMATVGG